MSCLQTSVVVIVVMDVCSYWRECLCLLMREVVLMDNNSFWMIVVMNGVVIDESGFVYDNSYEW